eukprot:CAMPEP_0174324886 /NCGR_PEP_ID=MMETSP0810-20121108/12820_1 /TAXON_ID=73025 ORGANISM="Eutreptiella gymnastica-like, Strain CCMP1594" /NCGR_SAMPLE_ID=MMETSP0810 /ASSEMBLY_ACC=CAM_ASM_000659 /LENGTH=108 /DNA_ID=CAMNT_0015437891 /DNA_START=151 /DNA_END=474 /DNA_ORIENTATION=-
MPRQRAFEAHAGDAGTPAQKFGACPTSHRLSCMITVIPDAASPLRGTGLAAGNTTKTRLFQASRQPQWRRAAPPTATLPPISKQEAEANKWGKILGWSVPAPAWEGRQ